MISECTWEQAREIVRSRAASLDAERISVRDAFARVSAEDIQAVADLPAYATSSMDGWVIAGTGPWKKSGEVHTGIKSLSEISNSQAMRIATGGVIPSGALAVLPWESAIEETDYIKGEITAGENIRPAGTEAKAGEIICKAGVKISAAHIGLFAATGIDFIQVVKKPRVSLFYLGDELIHEGTPRDGKIRDALGVQLPAVFHESGCEIHQENFVEDDLDLLISKVQESLNWCDIIVTTGGTADGPRDFVKTMFEAIGAEYLLDRVRVRPGYHILISQVNLENGRKVICIALPGNPQSAILGLTAFGLPLIDSLQNRTSPKELTVELSREMESPVDFSRHVIGSNIEGIFYPADYLGSAMLRGLASSDGFAVLNPGVNARGSKVIWVSLQC